MIVKIFSFLLLIAIVYGFWVFFAPEITSRIETFVWLPGLSENIRSSKEKLDFVSTDGVSSTFESVMQARESAREVVDTTKDRIDTIRQQAGKIEASVQDVQENIDTLIEVYESTSKNIEEVSETLKNISWSSETWALSE